MPWMTAVRLDGKAVTYGELYDSVVLYDRIVAQYALSENAALAAALISLMPESLQGQAPATQAQWVSNAITWLSRGLDQVDGGHISAAV
jgi:hypothetical protein